MNKEQETELERLINKDIAEYPKIKTKKKSIRERLYSIKNMLIIPMFFFVLCIVFRNLNIDLQEFVVKFIIEVLS